MTLLMAIAIGGLTATAVALILRRSITELIFGLILLSHAANLFVFAASGLTRADAPLVADDAQSLSAAAADPLPQALVLTAIVIGFGVVAFAAVLVSRVTAVVGTDDVHSMKYSESL